MTHDHPKSSFLGHNGWTGGQYSLFRVTFGIYLCIHFAQLVPWGAELFSDRGALPDAAESPLAHLFPNILSFYDPSWLVTALLIVAATLAVVFAIGWRDRVAAVVLWYLWACFFGRNPLTANPGLPYVGLMLLAHALILPAPYGSLAARGRTDPGGGWCMPQPVWAVVWVLMALGYTYSGFAKLTSPSWLDGSALRHVLENPLARPTPLREMLLSMPAMILSLLTWAALALEICFAPVAIFRRLRPFVWMAGLGMHLGLMVLIDFVDLSLGLVMLHLFTFNPAWIRPRAAEGVDVIFYDGHCGLCHRSVRFVLSEDRHAAFRFAPLQSEAFERAIEPTVRATLPDSIIVHTATGGVLSRSSAIAYILSRLGGAWRIIGCVLRSIPTPLRDLAYNGVARVRYRLFKRPDDACPMLPPALRARFVRTQP